jgi:hypothetical protein
MLHLRHGDGIDALVGEKANHGCHLGLWNHPTAWRSGPLEREHWRYIACGRPSWPKNVGGESDEPTKLKALTLQFQPEFMDILPLYIVLLAVLPLVLIGFRLWPAEVLAASFGLWGAAQLNKSIALPAYPGPDHVWFFNPFCWQVLFFLGAWCGWHEIREGIPWPGNRWLFRLAAASVRAGFLIRFSWTLHWLYDPFPALFGDALWPLLSKTNLAALRFANVLVLALLVARLIPAQAPFLSGRVARPLIMCGQHSLHIFCLGILLATIGRLVIGEFLGGVLLQCVVSVAGIAIMIGTAAAMDWFNAGQHPSGPRVLRASATDGRV